MAISNASLRAASNGFQAGATFNTSSVTSTSAQAFFPTTTNTAASLFVFNQDTTNALWVGISTATATTTLIGAYTKISSLAAGESAKFEFDGSFAFCVFGKTTNSVTTTFFFSDATKIAASAS